MKQLIKMFLNLKIKTKGAFSKEQKKEIKKLNKLFVKEIFKFNKVAFYYENINDGKIVSFNSNVTFYAASTIKILVCLYLFKQANERKVNLNEKILVKLSDLRPGSGVIKYIKEDKEFTLSDLIKYAIVESDDTAYIKLMEYVGKEKIAEFGRSLGAKHTMKGVDLFGIISCDDMIIYWKEIRKFIESNEKNSKLFKDYLINPSVRYINDESINHEPFVRKYGEHATSYHEVGYVDSKRPYYLLILTQLNEKEYKEKFINDVAKLISDVHRNI